MSITHRESARGKVIVAPVFQVGLPLGKVLPAWVGSAAIHLVLPGLAAPEGGRIMATSLSLLCLEVYYRHLFLYRRDLGVVKEMK
jgi:hypothetical protein